MSKTTPILSILKRRTIYGWEHEIPVEGYVLLSRGVLFKVHDQWHAVVFGKPCPALGGRVFDRAHHFTRTFDMDFWYAFVFLGEPVHPLRLIAVRLLIWAAWLVLHYQFPSSFYEDVYEVEM